MPKLMIAKKATAKDGLLTRIGGLPAAPEGTPWPRCARCSGPMQFLAQILLADTSIEAFAKSTDLLLLFECQNEPGSCDDWDPESGGNAALIVPITDLEPLSPPALTAKERKKGFLGQTTLDKTQGVTAKAYDDARKADTPDDAYVEAIEKKGEAVLGKLGGRPVWIQGDETPKCACGRKMTFVAQIEYHAGGGINFGDCGAGYAFACTRCKNKAKFLWQCS